MRILVIVLFMWLQPASATSFFGVQEESSEGQRLELETWLTDNLRQAYENFLPRDSFYIQTKFKLASNAPRISSISLGKLSAFSPVLAEMQRANRALLERLISVTFIVTIDDKVTADTRVSLMTVAKHSVPLLDRSNVTVEFMVVEPASVTIREVWQEIKWPLTSIFVAFLFSFTLMRISGLEWPHLRNLGREFMAALQKTFTLHRKLIQVAPQFRKHAFEHMQEHGVEAELPPYVEDPQSEVRAFVNSLGVNELAQLISGDVSFAAQVVWLLAPEKQHKARLLVDAPVLQKLALKIVETQDIQITVADVQKPLNVIRAGCLAKGDKPSVAAMMASMSISEEKELYRQFIKANNEASAVTLALTHVPGEICFELSPEILRAAFRDLDLPAKMSLLASLGSKKDAFCAKVVIPGSKFESLLQDKSAQPVKHAVNGELLFVQACREYLRHHPHEAEKYHPRIKQWVKVIGGVAHAKAA